MSDVHTTTAASLFNIKEDQVTPKQRSIGKTLNMQAIYGMSPYRAKKLLMDQFGKGDNRR